MRLLQKAFDFQLDYTFGGLVQGNHSRGNTSAGRQARATTIPREPTSYLEVETNRDWACSELLKPPSIRTLFTLFLLLTYFISCSLLGVFIHVCTDDRLKTDRHTHTLSQRDTCTLNTI